jgi:hypothetical protein
MGKSLTDKLQGGFRSIKRNLKNIIISAVAGAFLYGAQCVPVPPEPNNPPEITSNPITSINEGTIYNYDVDATDPDGDKLIYSFNPKSILAFY